MALQNRWLVLAIVSSALFLIVIDMTVLYTALPRLTHDLAASASEKLWIINAYPLVVAGLLPGVGNLGDRLGHKRMFTAGLAVFGLASLAAAYAPTAEVLIAARVLLAVGAAMMMPATLSIIRLTFEDEHERSFAIGIWAAVASGGAAFGPVVGGVLLEYFWWGSVFLINVPVVVIALLFAVFVLESRPGNKNRKWDLIGSIQVMIGLVGVTFGLKELAKRDGSLVLFAVTMVVGLIALVVFYRRQRATNGMLIDFSLFSNRKFSSGVMAASVSSAALIGVELVFSQRLQLVAGYSPLEAGLLILPIPLAAFVAGPLVGWGLPKIGAARVLWGGMMITGLGCTLYLLSFQLQPQIWLIGLMIMGFGVGASMTGASTAIMGNAPQEKAGMAASVEEVSFELGGATGVTIFGSLMTAIYTAFMVVPAGSGFPETLRDSLDEALLFAETLPADQAQHLREIGFIAFDQAFMWVIATAALLIFATALLIFRMNRKVCEAALKKA
ncbi:MFS transporter [Bacillus subtilis]|uniref:MFS transporter n=1 Tax=Pseudochrobactrum asaccharolyticum TaxID=354351 RepID=UPI001F0173D9|nr:MFS transporter [Pseudochrobactrum asaccharolyticum]MCF7645692.1 MFS transporter [Pseudochrobactrum asaccharolyticum]MCF7671243.1 MFS transporter [Bacillus subtilis]